MDIRDVMTGIVETLPPTATLRECSERMRDVDVGFMPIQQEGRVLGVVTDRDIVVRALADGMDPAQTCVQQIMSGDLVTCYEDEDIRDAAERMEQNQVRRVLVFDRADQLVGVLALGDLATAMGDEDLGGEVLERISDPSTPALL